MAIIYSLISRGSTVLVEYTEKRGNFQQVSKQILEKIPSKNTKVSYLYDSYVFHIMVDKGITYFCMSDKDFGNRIPFEFLEDIKGRFQKTYGEEAKRAEAMAYNREFRKVLREQMERFSNAAQNDRIVRVKGQIQEVKDIMIDNIDKVLDRGEKINLLVDKTQDLTDTALDFRIKSKKLKRTMWWRNVKLLFILIFIILVVVGAITWWICGFPTFHNCRKWFSPKKPSPPPGSGSQ